MRSQESDMIWWLNNKNCRLVYYTSQRRYRDDSVLVFNTLRIELSLVNFCIFLKKKFQKKHAYLFVHFFTKQITFKCLLCTKHCSDVTGYKHWKITAPALLAQACSAPLPVESLRVSHPSSIRSWRPWEMFPTAPESVAPSILPSLPLFISLGYDDVWLPSWKSMISINISHIMGRIDIVISLTSTHHSLDHPALYGSDTLEQWKEIVSRDSF